MKSPWWIVISVGLRLVTHMPGPGHRTVLAENCLSNLALPAPGPSHRGPASLFHPQGVESLKHTLEEAPPQPGLDSHFLGLW
jgi:hypothetical protein